MNSFYRRILQLNAGALALAGLLTGCVEPVPPDVMEAVESVDRDLSKLRASELSPEDYTRFAHQWMKLKAQLDAEYDAIRWPWEPNDLAAALRLLRDEGIQTVARLTQQRESLRRSAEERLVHAEERSHLIALQVNTIDGRLMLGQKPVETDLLIKQARSFYKQGQFGQSLRASQQAMANLDAQASLLSSELGRYANPERISRWQQMVKDTVDWSRSHQTSAIVISKADRLLTLYRNGQKVLSYPVRLGFNGIREKRYQGDGATPEGRYHVATKRGQGQTQFYRALVLNYPNADDQRRFLVERKTGLIPGSKGIGGQIEIHGIENELMAQTLGCVMLDNPHMAFLFTRVEKGTLVTIVGALHEQNSVSLVLTHLTERTNEI